MTIRKEIRSLTVAELLDLRRAMMVFQAKKGINSYIDLAGYHGIPKWLCEHQNEVFLAWHRIYIAKFEKELQRIDANVFLPFWDWTSVESLQKGLAPAQTVDQFADVDGQKGPNPLKSGPIEDRSRNTKRNTKTSLSDIDTAAKSVKIAYRETDFVKFNGLIEGPHGTIHVWIGGQNLPGDMSSFDRAAYDPIFWSHHANIDRQWAIWQQLYPGTIISNNILETELKGFTGIKVKNLIDHKNELLDYTYEGMETTSRLFEHIGNIKSALENFNIASPRILFVDEIERGGESFSVDIFLKNKKSGHEVFAGSFGIFGMGMKMGHDHAHAGGHHFFKSQQYIDISEALKKINAPDNDIEIKLSGMNMNGDEIKQSDLPVGKVSIL